ncbi:tautomerase family protein [Methylobacterium oryzisoli]|uniref:tautomerase family protein n=1 Tax=Methylobacterium oryzisoli TaxID=3385502 RepID=UPI0038911B66
MPSTRIETRAGWLGERRRDLIEAVQAALIDGFLIPERDRCVRLLEFEPGAFIVPPDRGTSYMVVEVTLFSGRSLDAKRRFYRSVVERTGRLGVPASDIKIILLEVPPENWGLSGLPASEIDLGFKVDV